MKILITGGTGTVGKTLASKLTGNHVTIFSRKEADQVAMRNEYPYFKYVIGDVRDYSEVLKVSNVDYVYHFAAMKHINICEEQPQEAVKTNVLGTLNVTNACLKTGAKLVNMSSDKAINPASVYGMTKKLAEDIATQSGYVSVRSGNVLWSSGSVLPIWKESIKKCNSISLTSDKMTRFFVSPDELTDFILWERDSKGVKTVGMKAFRMVDIAKEFIYRFGDKNTVLNITELRPGERLHEFRDELTSSECNVSTDLDYIFQ